MRSHSLLVTIAVATLMSAACRNAPKSAAQSSESPVPAAVGPIPGGLVEVNRRMNPYANDPVALQDGRRLFDWYNCSGCHGGHAGGGMGPSLRDETWIYGNRDDQVFDSIAEGRANGMPSWATKIPEDQIWQLVGYIKSMRTPAEPDPPLEPADENVDNPSSQQQIAKVPPSR